MANYWTADKNEWVRQSITGDCLVLHSSDQQRDQRSTKSITRSGEALMKKFARTDSTTFWAMLCSPNSRTRINGKLLSGGLHILSDRDEVSFDGNSLLYFSTEEVATVEPFPVSDHPVFCARCRQSIEHGTSAVKCPSCGHWCEQSESKPCWNYGPTCPLCDQPTAFDTGLRWTPEAL